MNSFNKIHCQFLAGNGMRRAFETQKYIEISLARVYNGSLVLKAKELGNFESMLSVAQ